MTTTTTSSVATDSPPPEDRPDPAALGALRVELPGSNVAVGPVGYLADERRRLDALSWQHFDASPCSATIGAEISGIRLADDLRDDVVAEIADALGAYKVLFFRDQPMTPQQHVAFASRFGALEVHPFLPANGEVPEVVRFAKSADVGGYENGWHHDVTWRATPSKGAVLHALSVPRSGGDTVFSDAYAALDSLPPDVREQIDGLVAVHDFANVFGHTMAPDELAAMRELHPPVEHPVVATHPVTGRDHLYVNRFFVSEIVGMDPADGRALLDRLCRAFELLEHQVRFKWEPDSVAFWDNRAVQHYACSDYWPDVRVMERASVIGDRPTRVR